MMEHKILASNVIFLNYAHSNSDLKKYFAAVDKVFKKISSLKRIRKLKSNLVGKPSKSGFFRLN